MRIVPLENLDEFSVPTYSAQELMNRKDFSEMGTEESRAIAQSDTADRHQDRHSDQPAQENRPQRSGDRSARDHAAQHEIRRRSDRDGASQKAHQENQSRATVRCQRLDGLLQPFSDSVHVRPAKRAVGRRDFRFQHIAQPDYPSDSHQEHRRCVGQDFRHILGWSGGTNIGRSLHTFNRNFAPSMVTHRTVVVIISDGWDRGDVSLLEKEMQDIKRRAKKIIWLNPLAGERKLRTAVQRHASGAAVFGYVFVGAQCQ